MKQIFSVFLVLAMVNLSFANFSFGGEVEKKPLQLEEMVELATRTGMLWDPVRMIEAVQAREQLQSTAMPNGVALLHPRRPLADVLGEPLLALGVSPQGAPAR